MFYCLYSLKTVFVFVFGVVFFIWLCFTNSVLESLKTVGNLLKAILNYPGGWRTKKKIKASKIYNQNILF